MVLHSGWIGAGKADPPQQWRSIQIAISKNLEFYLDRECRKKPDGLCKNQCFDAKKQRSCEDVDSSMAGVSVGCNQTPQSVSPWSRPANVSWSAWGNNWLLRQFWIVWEAQVIKLMRKASKMLVDIYEESWTDHASNFLQKICVRFWGFTTNAIQTSPFFSDGPRDLLPCCFTQVLSGGAWCESVREHQIRSSKNRDLELLKQQKTGSWFATVSFDMKVG